MNKTARRLEATRAGAPVTDWIRRIVEELKIRRDLRALQRLDGRMLKDIGLQAGGLERAVRDGRMIEGSAVTAELNSGEGMTENVNAAAAAAKLPPTEAAGPRNTGRHVTGARTSRHSGVDRNGRTP